MQEINPERQESPGSGDGDELIKTDNDEVSPLVFNCVCSVLQSGGQQIDSCV
jgi:hypothetical protein